MILPNRIGAYALLFLMTVLAGSATAHEVRPGYLQLKQTAAESYNALWKVPGAGEDLRLALHVSLPDNCSNTSQPRGVFASNAFTEQWTFTCDGGLTGGLINIVGLSATMTDVLVRIERLDGTTQMARLHPSSTSFVVEDSPFLATVIKTYLTLGIEHILTGWDHLFYILGMLLLVNGWKRVVLTMSAFTASHSVTLTGAALGWVHVPQMPVEACIALSILFVSREAILSDEMKDSLASRWPWVISLTFGLLHGFGFAGALSEVGLPEKAIPAVLLFFNVGVEIGQLVFILTIFSIFTASKKLQEAIGREVPTWLHKAPAHAIGTVAAFWFIQRLSRFWL